jgi:DNA-binding SARP family transcriptional activator/tetratricopeptide (TPR) repeat protein
MEFRILGPLEVVENGHMLDLGGQKQRALLAVLLLHANEVVSSDRLIDALWPERPPQTAVKAVQVYVSGLRKTLGRERVETKAPGYLLRVHEGELDLDRCRHLADDGRPGEALALWRGGALTDFAYEPFAQTELARFEELRLACLADRIELDLVAGRHPALVGELEALVADYPLRERFHAQLMLALYRSGRQAEALDVYQAGRSRLSDELGLEPGEALKGLQRAILEHDPALDLPSTQVREPAVGDVGSPASAPAGTGDHREVRKTVTVLFVSVESQGDVESLDPETQRRLAGRAFSEIGGAVESHGGTVETVAGDSMTAVFGVPAVHEDDALRALRAAAHLRERLSGGQEIDVRVGVSTGEVVTGGTTTEARSTGRPITVAARLGQAAAAGELLLDEATYRLVRDAIDVDPAERGLRFVGFRTDAFATRSRFNTPMIGRERERRRLRDAFEQATGDRSCQLFTILGPAGVGKSRLVQEFVGELEVCVVRGRCLPYGTGITYFPLMEAVRELAGIEDADAPEEGLAKVASLLEREEDAALVARRVGELVGLAEVGVGMPESFGAVCTLLESVARRAPLVIVFDDIHWGEATFLDLVEYLADWMREAPALIIAVARPELLDVRPGWSGGKLNATTVLLEPLSDEESAHLVEMLAGAHRLAEATRHRIVAAAEGNPLFVEEMLALVVENGQPDADIEVPPTIQALLAARLDRLGEDDRAVIELAAVQGKEFFDAAVSELAPEQRRPRLAGALGSLVRKELIRPDRGGLGGRTYRFRHQLIRDAAYDSIPKHARAELHEAFAAWLERAVGERAAEYDDVVGYHYEQAYWYRTEVGDVDDHARELGRHAAERLGAAGQRALMRSDAAAGSNLISRAVALLRPEDPLRVDLIPNVRGIQGLSGDLGWADLVLTEAVETAATTGDRRLAAHALLQRAFLRLFTGADTTPDSLLETAERAVAVFDELGDELGLARAWRLAAQAHYLGRRAAACATASERALPHGRRSGDRLEEREIVEWLLLAYAFGPLPLEEAIARLRVLLADVGSNPTVKGLINSTIALFEANRGRTSEAEVLLERSRRMIENEGELIPLMLWASVLTSLVSDDDYELAEADLREGYDALRGMGRVGYFSGFCALLARLSYEFGHYEEAGEYAKEAAAATRANDVHDQVSWRATLAKVLARTGRFDDAEALARGSLALAEDGDFLFSHAEALHGLAEVLRIAGRTTEAIASLEEAIRLYEQKGNVVAAANARAELEAL